MNTRLFFVCFLSVFIFFKDLETSTAGPVLFGRFRLLRTGGACKGLFFHPLDLPEPGLNRLPMIVTSSVADWGLSRVFHPVSLLRKIFAP